MLEDDLDREVRHRIYQSFAKTGRAATVGQVANQLQISRRNVEGSFERLAANHDIALAPGSYSVWMAHPFSGVMSDYAVQLDGKVYYGN